MLTLHQHPLSTFARRVRIVLLEKNLEARWVEVDMAAKEHRGAKYLKLNPHGRVPTLVDGDFVLYESTAILEYLEAQHPQPALVPGDPRERALMAMHIKLCDLEVSIHTRSLYFPRRFLPKERWDLAAMDRARQQIDQHLRILDEQLQGRRFLAGDVFSLAEVCYAPFVDFFALAEVVPPPRVNEWIARFNERPSVQQTRLPR